MIGPSPPTSGCGAVRGRTHRCLHVHSFIKQSPQNLHKETWNYHYYHFSSCRWWTVERTNNQDEQNEPNIGDEPPQEPEGKVWVSFTCPLREGSIMADISAEYWWSLFVSPEREQPGAESVGRGTGCWGQVWTTVSWTESWFPVRMFCGLTSCLVGARPRTERLCSGWSIHPQSISDRGEVRCLLRAQRILKKTKRTRRNCWCSLSQYVSMSASIKVILNS